MLESQTNKILFETQCEQICNIVLDRIERMMSSESLLASSSYELFQEGFSDPVRVFIKNEPHTKKKISSNLERIIGGVSVVDQIIDRFLFSAQNVLEIDNYENIPSKAGMGLNDDGIDVIYGIVKAAEDKGVELCEFDVSGWDWTVQPYEFDFDCELRIELYGLSPQSDLANLMRKRMHCIKNSVFVTSSGYLLAQTVPGIMKSGLYCTASTNSHVNYFNLWQAGASWAIVMGDDGISQFVEGLKETYERSGKYFKLSKRVTSSDFNFCSTQFTNGKGVPTNLDKIVLNALARKNLTDAQFSELSIAWKFSLRNLPDKGEAIMQALKACHNRQ